MDHLDVTAKFIRGFADKTRLQILYSLIQEGKTVSQLIEEIGASQSRISQHLACLRDCGIVESRQEGKYVYYSVKNEDIISLLRMFDIALQPVKSLVSCCETVETLTCLSADNIESKKGSKLNEQSMEQVDL
ncbi:ArsR/SmtB family transcription factor [Paenibacillus durus]|uniref:ArsR family transcriptional regulator n=1 Tax=Paenibacillus durus TaxID=44251 RepID=A0A089HSM0_PAEDU|nr:metalloregulator ArsR/SmtB family transcription factor [Paenibacillus durus]AIQ13745.1 ArsR family transcriptional regulator [Paenibacillus durus]